MSVDMTVMQYGSKFIELSGLVPEFMWSERLKIGRLEEALSFYIRNELAG